MTGTLFFVAALVQAQTQAPAPALIEPDELLTVPHILRTPLLSSFAVAPDGKRVALSLSVLGKEAIWMIPGDGTPGAMIETTKGTGERDCEWSPVGEEIAFTSNRSGAWLLYVSRPDGSRARLLSDPAGEDKSPRFSPDGKDVAFLRRRDPGETGYDLWLARADGSEPMRRVTDRAFDEEEPRWSPDGKKIALTTGGGRHQPRRIAVVSLESGDFLDVLPGDWKGDSFSPRWSPDGIRLAFVSDETGGKSIFTIPAEGGTPEPLVRSEFELTEPAFSPDGKTLAFLENREGDSKLIVHDFATGRARPITLRNGVHSHLVWRPDGKAVLSLFEAWNYSRDIWSYSLDGSRERVSDTLPPDLDVRKMIRPELVRYKSFDGREITGYLYVPEGASPAAPASLLVTPHGGPTSQWRNGWYPFIQLLAQTGYAVFAPNVRGSSGFGVEFENLNDRDWGRGDLEDLVRGTRHVTARPEIRDDRVGIWGVSYGGFLTLAAIARHPDLFTCAVEALGMPDLERLYRDTNFEGRGYLEREIGPLRGNLALYRELSLTPDAPKVMTPLLSFHGEIYPLVPYSVKRPFFDELRKRPSYPLLEFIFKGEEARAAYRHDLHPSAAWAYVEKILAFLEVYL